MGIFQEPISGLSWKEEVNLRRALIASMQLHRTARSVSLCEELGVDHLLHGGFFMI